MAGYGELASLVENAKREATIAEMTCNGWELQGEDTFEKSENYGESYYSQTVTLDGRASGYSYNIGMGGDDPALAQAALDELNAVKGKWDNNIDHVVNGWDILPEPSTWDANIKSLQAAIQKVAGGTGGDDSQFGNPDLTEIGFIRKYLPANAGHTVATFYRLYGPEKIELVLDGHCEVMACLGVALKGEQEIFTAARDDVANTMAAAVEAFKQTRHNNSTDWKALLSVATAGIGLLSAFTAGVPGLAAVLTAAGATGGFLSAALAAVPQDEKAPKELPYKGSHPDDVYRDLKSAFTSLDERIGAKETGLQSMLTKMTGFVTDGANRPNFHIHPEAGLAKEFGPTDDVIDMKYSDLETIGYTSMPMIAKAFFQAADLGLAGRDQSTWYRPYASVPGGSIGMEYYGPFDAWESLLYAVFPLMNDTGAELVRAGELLAEAAGYVRDSDAWAKQSLGNDYEHLEGAGLGWQKPYEEPPPPPPPHHGGGRPIPY